jgi:hypothetical protein
MPKLSCQVHAYSTALTASIVPIFFMECQTDRSGNSVGWQMHTCPTTLRDVVSGGLLLQPHCACTSTVAEQEVRYVQLPWCHSGTEQSFMSVAVLGYNMSPVVLACMAINFASPV